MEVFKNNVSLEATPTGDTHVTNKSYVDSKQKTISWADYQALSESEKNNGTTYYIPDMPVSTGGEAVGSAKYCNAKLATDQTPGGNIPSNTLVLFESSSDDTIKVTNGLVTLEQGNTYNIICDLRATHDTSKGDGIIEFALKDSDGNIYGNPGVNRINLSSESESPCSVYSYTITPTKDITVGIYTCSIRFATSILASNSRLTITEIPSLQACIDVTDDHIREVASGGIADVGKTSLNLQNVSSGSISYYVSNGIAYVSITNLATTSSGATLILSADSLPKPNGILEMHFSVASISGTSGLIALNSNGSLTAYVPTSGYFYGTFSYQVGEN